jgi:hypothetical protein
VSQNDATKTEEDEVTDRVVAALNRMTINPNRQRVRGEGSHAWTLKNKCRFCGMAREDFRMQGRPDCKGQKPKAVPQANDKSEPRG